MDVEADQVLAFRLAGQGLAEPPTDAASVLRGWAVQDSPPGAAVGAALARLESVAVGWLDEVLFKQRSAVVATDEVAAYGTSMVPADDAGLKAVVGPALPDRKEGFAEPVALAVEAIADVLDGAVLSRDDLHEGLRQRLPEESLPWCPGCESHHARRGLLVMASLHGRRCLAGRVGRQPAFARTDQWVSWGAPTRTEAGAELRLLAPGDPLLLGRDRERLVPDESIRKRLWSAIGGPGLVLSDGEPVALWRARKQGKRLAVSVEAFRSAPWEPIRAAAERLGPHRGCDTGAVELSAA